MQSIALSTVLDVLSVEERRACLADPSLVALQGVFAAAPDPRKRRGLRYDLPFLLTCVVPALLSNCNSVAAVGQWCRKHRALLFRWLLPRLSVAEVDWALAGWVRATRAAWEREALAFDGKTVRGAALRHADGTSQAPHLLSVSGHESHETLIRVRVDGKTNEIPSARWTWLSAITRRRRRYTRQWEMPPARPLLDEHRQRSHRTRRLRLGAEPV